MRQLKQRELKIYAQPSGKRPFIEWLENKIKNLKTRTRIEVRLDRLALGIYGDCEPVGEGVFELKLHFGSGYRIYFAECNKEIILLLCGGDKSSQDTDIRCAKVYWKEARGIRK